MSTVMAAKTTAIEAKSARPKATRPATLNAGCTVRHASRALAAEDLELSSLRKAVGNE